jgi:hypothetical protein
MNQQFYYETITEAITVLRKQGYTSDFNMTGGLLKAEGKQFDALELEIAEVYRYEGLSDPADEATVFALATPCGIKGILVTGYGPSMTYEDAELIKKLHYQRKQD